MKARILDEPASTFTHCRWRYVAFNTVFAPASEGSVECTVAIRPGVRGVARYRTVPITAAAATKSAKPFFMRILLRSAKGAARTIVHARNCFAPRSVLREFLKRS